MGNDEILEKLEQADMVLAGLGEDFDADTLLRQDKRYLSGCEKIENAGLHWLMPAWSEFCLEKSGSMAMVDTALEKLADILKGKNHFVVSVSMNSKVAGVGRVVMPCGSSRMKQCAGGCKETLMSVTEQDEGRLGEFFQGLCEGRLPGRDPLLEGVCPVCGQALILNNVYAENYNEEGYLEQWRLYTKWLQGTLNRELFVLELGVGMRFPSVIRWPFEKVAFFNRKAFFCRIHEKLYQLTKELSEKGSGISKNAIDWLGEL